MALSLLDITTCDDVRGALGASAKETPDSALTLSLYADVFEMELRSISEGLPADISAALLEYPLTEPSRLLLSATRLFVSYVVALSYMTSAVNSLPRSITDGKAGFIRHTDKVFLNTKQEIADAVVKYRQNLEKVYASYAEGFSVASRVITLLDSSIPDFDPVTGA